MARKRKKKKAGPGRILLLKIFTILVLIVVFIAGALFLYLGKEIDRRFASRKWSVPAVVFSDTVFCFPGQKLSSDDMKQMLLRRWYREVSGRTPEAGEFRIAKDRLDVHLRRFEYAGRNLPARMVHIVFRHKLLKEIKGERGELPFLELEPIEIARLFGEERESRHLISINRVPQYLIDAVTAIEDHRFFDHPGVDWQGILRALWADVRARRVVQGGSTITQQLVKNYFLRADRTIKRKILEACMALILEARYSKKEILEMYFNEIYLGQRGSVEIHGMGEAARYYFGRNVEDLNLPEAATLAGIIRAPNAYSPYRNPKACKQRRNLVLKRMLELGKISRQEYEQARHAPLRTIGKRQPLKIAPYFVDAVRKQLNELYSPEVLASEGLNIYTSLHPEIAEAAEHAVKEGLDALEKSFPRLRKNKQKGPLQAVLIAVQPRTGQVLALVGGRDYDASSYNRALLAHRQPGSAFKPFVYLAALDQFNPMSRIQDEPVTYRVDGKDWSPRNYDGRYRGPVTLKTALAKSLNAATVNLAMQIGLDRIIETAKRLGIRSPLAPYPSLALGAFEVTPMELADAYAALDNDGQRPYLLSLKKVVTPGGTVEQNRHINMVTVTTPARAFLITHMLQAVMDMGTGSSARRLGIRFPCAGKTGTTSDYRDSWFVGYTNDLLALVWVGFDDNRPTYLSGSRGALRIWVRFMKAIQPWLNPQPFRVPPGIVVRYVCKSSGLLATRACPEPTVEYFLKDHVPTRFCPLHGGGSVAKGKKTHDVGKTSRRKVFVTGVGGDEVDH